THVDGHQHVHSCLNVLLSGALPRHLPLRRVVIDDLRPRALARARQALAARRFASTDLFVSLGAFVHVPDSAHAAELVREAEYRPVEVMVHPAAGAERRFLESNAWE